MWATSNGWWISPTDFHDRRYRDDNDNNMVNEFCHLKFFSLDFAWPKKTRTAENCIVPEFIKRFVLLNFLPTHTCHWPFRKRSHNDNSIDFNDRWLLFLHIWTTNIHHGRIQSSFVRDLGVYLSRQVVLRYYACFLVQVWEMTVDFHWNLWILMKYVDLLRNPRIKI